MYTPSLERYLTFINSGTPRGFLSAPEVHPPKLAITISRQSGSGAHSVAEKLAEELQRHERSGQGPWLTFDRNLAEKVLEDNNLPRHLAKYMPEDKISAIADTIDEIFGLHPPFWTLMEKTSQTILRLAEQGNVILIGRGANVITRELKHVFHVRLVGSVENRVLHLQEIRDVGRKEALELIQREDRGRERYLKKYFGKDINDPSLYHLTINTDVISYDEAARMIAEAALGMDSKRLTATVKANPRTRTTTAAA